MTLRTKLLLICISLITVPFLVSGAVTYKQYARAVEKDARSFVVQIVEQIGMNFDHYLRELDKLTVLPFYQDTLLDVLRTHERPIGELVYLTQKELHQLKQMTTSMARKDFTGIAFLMNDGALFSSSGAVSANRWKTEESPWLREVLAGDGSMVLLPPHPATYYPGSPDVVSVARLIREPWTNRPLGILKIDLNEEAPREFLSSVRLGSDSRVQVTDTQGRLIFSSPAASTVGSDRTREAADDIRETAVSGYYGLRIEGILSKHDMKKDAGKLVTSTFYVSLICMVGACIVAALFADRLVRPIRHLQSKMKMVRQGHFSQRARVAANDEIGQLTEGFNRMIEEIDRLVNEVYETKVRERDAEITALQSSINPHFMYNTLELINMIALQSYNYEVSDVVSSFGKLMRYTVDKKRKPVCLRDEFRFVEAYMQIQSCRFGDRIAWTAQLPSELADCLVPKLLLQPLIENAIQHGIGETGGALSVTAAARGGDLVVQVRDNGRGMEPHVMAAVRELFENGEETAPEDGPFGSVRKGYALFNVFRRIRLLYGEPYGLFIEDGPGPGCVFSVRLPIVREWTDETGMNKGGGMA